ncbi:hypothetical protein N7470_005680 [Penicillium chermesinum]|nr:hypothetical protein N7470_005680 [Penicillium chermesinum]
MGRIKKAATQKHEATVSPFLADFIASAINLPVPELPAHLRTFPRQWPFPRGDLYHWIKVLDRFDGILAAVIDEYFLSIGPQTRSFGRKVLQDAYAAHDATKTPEENDARLDSLGYSIEGDRELVEALLEFSRLLLEKCGNRSLYSSSDRLGDFLNTTSLSLLQSTLRLSLCLAQRYHSRQRGSHQQTALAAHYNIDLEKLQKIAAPFPRPFNPTASPSIPTKGKEKSTQTKLNANELVSLVRDQDGWEEWGHRLVNPKTPPATPTPLRRSATQPTPRLSRGSNVDDTPVGNTPNTGGKAEEVSRSGKILDLPVSKLSSAKVEDILATHLPHLPLDSKYELLHKIRVARALAGSASTREQILAIRILAATNLAYVHTESTYQQKILQYDMELPKRLQLTFQLAELVHLGASDDIKVSRTLQTLAIQALDALAKHKSRANDVCAALSVNVNHGVLMFLTRKVVNELGAEDDGTDNPYHDEWRDALLALLRTLPSSGLRTPDTLVAAGLIPMFVDILNLRTQKARRVYSRIMEFLDTFVHAVRDALGTLTAAKGFDAISDLIDHETKTAFESVQRGEGFPAKYKYPTIDYQIPYFQQQTLRWMFRFVNHIMTHNGGGFDRVLRNLIDSPQILTSLRLVFENVRVFGSHVWSNAVNILSSFIHNEPTSYAVIAEAGLSRSLLAAVMGRELNAEEKPPAVEPEDADPEPESEQLTQGHLQKSLLAMLPKKSAFGAICLNSSGLDLFQSSDALESFFEIFESPEHVKCLKDDPNLVRQLGTAFDELIRHHPALKSSIMSAVIVMVARVNLLARVKTWKYGLGTKLWKTGPMENPSLSGDISSLFRAIGAPLDGSVEDPAVIGVPPLNPDRNRRLLPNGTTLVLGDLNDLLPSNEKVSIEDVDENGLTVADYLFPAMRFLGALFENQPNCSSFIEAGAAELVLDYATIPSLPYDFHGSDANQELTVLVHMLAETKPHLIIPSLVHRAQTAVDNLSTFWNAPSETGFFTPLSKPIDSGDSVAANSEAVAHGTFYARHLNAALILTDILREVYALPLYQTRPMQVASAFGQVNLADKYCALVSTLGKLYSACVWESIANELSVPDLWSHAKNTAGGKPGAEKLESFLGLTNSEGATDPADASQQGGSVPANKESKPAASDSEITKNKIDEESSAFKNVETLRYLLSTLPQSITGFFHNLGLGLVNKRRGDHYVKGKQSANLVADAIAESVLHGLELAAPSNNSSVKARSAYLIIILSSFSGLLYEVGGDRPQSNYLTLVLLAFKRKNGLKVLKNICEVFMNEVKALKPHEKGADTEKEVVDRIASAQGGIKIILAIFAELVAGKSIVESTQTQAISTHERDRDRPDYFQAGQFLVDLRMEILPMAQEMWNSDFATQSQSPIVKFLVDILRSSLDGEYETGALTRADTPPALTEAPKKTFVIHKDGRKLSLRRDMRMPT